MQFMAHRILIVDDHPDVRQGIRQMVSEIYRDAYSEEAGDGQEAMNKIFLNDYDLVLLDISMPKMGGFEVLSRIKKEKPNVHVIMLSIHDEEHFANRSFKCGALGYLTKKFAAEELADAMETVIRGKTYLSRGVKQNN